MRRRNALGSLITRLVADGGGDVTDVIRPLPITPGTEHSYWLYALSVRDDASVSSQWFARALTAEGVPAGAGYIVEPIFRCMDALAEKRTFGDSGHPFTGAFGHAPVDYGPELCPRTREGLNRMVTIGINEGWSESDARDAAQAVCKVARAAGSRS